MRATGAPECPTCAGPMTVRFTRREGTPFYGCEAFPACRGSRDFDESVDPTDSAGTETAADAEQLLALLPVDGARRGNIELRNALGWSESRYAAARDLLVSDDRVVKGRGRGGSLGLAPQIPSVGGSTLPQESVRHVRGRVPTFEVGHLVNSTANEFGVGKVLSLTESEAVVEYLDFPKDDGLVEISIPRATLSRAAVEMGSRVFVRGIGGDFLPGFVEMLPTPDDPYYLVVHGRERFTRAEEADLYIRWAQPLKDVVRLVEAQFFDEWRMCDRRRRFREQVVRQRAGSQGLAGVLSSAAYFYSHQVEAASKVLTDPVQRYLLADEVGLGKTIEAGFVVRQTLIDNPSARIAVIAPGHLRMQWAKELDEKFLVRQFQELPTIYSHHLPETWPKDGVDLLVVDEAHRLMELEDDDGEVAYSALAALAAASPRLLLLSATPVRSNEARFLAMLHLLDPQNYQLHDLEGFRSRIRDRDELAVTFHSLTPKTPPFLLPAKINALRRICEGDEHLAHLLDELERNLARENDPATLISQVRSHVSDTYRLHRRLIRTRRSEQLAELFPVRGRGRPDDWLLADSCDRRQLSIWLEDFRLSLLRLVEDGAWPFEKLQASEVFSLVAERSMSDTLALRVVQRGLAESSSVDAAGGLFEIVSSLPLTDRAELADGLANVITETVGRRIEDAVEWCRSRVTAGGQVGCGERIVVFTTFSEVAQAFVDLYDQKYGRADLSAHLSSMTSEEMEKQVESFDEARSLLLVCDRSAEEGRNLQSTDLMLHLDVPTNNSALEQRIGRADRFTEPGRRSPKVENFVFSEGHNSGWADSWLGLVAEAFGVFERSVASLQYVIADAERSLWGQAFMEGSITFADSADSLSKSLEAEAQSIESQDSLDSMESSPHDLNVFQSLDELERNVSDIKFGFEGWARELGFIVKKNPSNSRRRKITGTFTGNFRVPTSRLFSMRPELMDQWGSFSRAVQAEYPGDRLFRYGDPFFDALDELTVRETRGRCFGTWRIFKRWPNETPLVALRYDFLVEADLEALSKHNNTPKENRATRRFIDGLLPPFTRSIWVDSTGEVIGESIATQLLESKMGPDDYRLEEFPDLLPSNFRADEWRDIVRKTRDLALIALTSSDSYRSLIESATASATNRLADLQRVAEARSSIESGLGTLRMPTAETVEQVVAAVSMPVCRVEGCGVTVVSRNPPAHG